MADETGISWTDHTFNPWWGCSRVAPGCDNCYAAALDNRTGGKYWDDVTVKPRLTKDANWRKPVKWNKQANETGIRHKVFCGSMMDWCDKNAPAGALVRLWQLIRETPYLDWQLLTKRATLIKKRLPDDWGKGYPNVWLGVTCENIEHGIPRVDALCKIPARVRFISAEPLLKDLDPEYFLNNAIDWIIIGGESGANCRRMDSIWVHNLIKYASLQHIPVWFKQWGGTGKDKGGNIIDGKLLHQWPNVEAYKPPIQQELEL